jgi:cell division protein FtsB
MTTPPYNANDVIADLAEQVKQLSLNNTILRAMLKQLTSDKDLQVNKDSEN